jgi:hypothetical protein
MKTLLFAIAFALLASVAHVVAAGGWILWSDIMTLSDLQTGWLPQEGYATLADCFREEVRNGKKHPPKSLEQARKDGDEATYIWHCFPSDFDPRPRVK